MSQQPAHDFPIASSAGPGEQDLVGAGNGAIFLTT
jgi:hypothetical protein